MRTELAKAFYYFDAAQEGTSGGRLKRIYATIKKGFDEQSTEEEILLDNLARASFEYAYETEEEYEWKGEWTSDDIPRGVRIRVEFANENAEKTRTFEKMVFIPIGKLGSEESSGTGTGEE